MVPSEILTAYRLSNEAFLFDVKHKPTDPGGKLMPRLHDGGQTFTHNPELTTIGEGQSVDRRGNQDFCLLARLFLHLDRSEERS